ncbi:MAG TPA: YceI family protein [Acidimicrobiia bacterium]
MSTSVTNAALPFTSGRWALDKNHSGIFFVVRHLGLSNVRGRFDGFDATLEIGSTLESVSVTADVDLTTVDTNNADRDAHLRSTDFFDTAQHSVMTFRSTAVSGSSESYELAGDLTIAGVTKPVTFDVEFNGTELFPADQSTHAGFSATGQIRRSDFGIDFGIIAGAEKLMLGDKIKVELDLQFVAP